MTSQDTLAARVRLDHLPRLKKSLRRGRDPLLVSLATITTGLWALRWPSLTQDEISLVLYADLINRGRVPNLDFFTPYGPGTFWPLAALFQILGSPSLFAARMFGLVLHVVVALGVWALARRHGPRVALLAGTLSGLLAADLLLTPYGWLAALSATLWSLVFARERRWLVSGALGAVACTVRPEFLPVVVIVQVTHLRDIPTVKRAALGFLLGAIPLWVHLYVAGPELFRNVFLDRLLPNARVSLSAAPTSVWLGLLLLAVGLLCLALDVLRTGRREEIDVALVSVLILPQAFQRTDREHILFVAVLVLPLAMAVVLRHLGARLQTNLRDAVADRVVVIVASSVIVIGGSLSAVAPHGKSLDIGGRSIIAAGPASAREIGHVVRAIDRRLAPRSVMFIGSEDMSSPAITPTYLYYLLPHRVPSAYYLELAPGVAERQGSRLMDDVKSAEALVLSEFSAAQRQELFPYLDDGSERVDDYISAHFCLVDHEAFVNIYKRCKG